MNFYNIVRISAVDYNGHIVTTVATSGCNFDCDYCHNYILKKRQPENVTEEEVFKTLDHKLIDGICITGGEPTIHGDLLIEFLEKVKKKNKLVKLDTNGYKPDVLEKLINNKLVDYVAMDIKGPTNKYSQISGVDVDLNKIFKSINLIMGNLTDYEFRTTVIPELDISDFDNIGHMIKSAKLYTIQQFFQTDMYKKNQKPIYELKKIAEVMKKYVKNVQIVNI